MLRVRLSSPAPGRRGARTLALVALVAGSLTLVSLGSAAASPAPAGPAPAQQPTGGPATEPEQASLVRLVVPDQAAFERLVASGADLTERVRFRPDGIEVDAVVTPSQLAELRQLGARSAETVQTPQQARERATESQTTAQEERQLEAATDEVTVERAAWFRTRDGYFLSVEATTSAGADPEVTLTAAWRGSGDTSGQAELGRQVDADVYMGHQTVTPVPAAGRPERVTVTSSQGGRATAQVTRWPGGERPPPAGPGYEKDFVTHYMAPAELYDRARSLHRRYPKLTDIIELPYKTNGYRRQAQAVVGTPPAGAMVVTSHAYGSEGGNDLAVEVVDPGAPGRPLEVTVDGKLITVSLATDDGGSPTSTAAQVAEALEAEAGELVSASTYRGNAGGDVMSPVPLTQLSDFLEAPASVSRKPMRVPALRIGVHRDGSRTGVFAYAQEHAREWVTPLVAIEAAERLLRNYDNDPTTRRLLRKTDIFVIPSVNPDGANYSFYDFNLQRKNMRNYCPPAQADPALRNTWGVDVNRNYAVGSRFDGYFGASSGCQSGVYAGPAEHSEPESRNVIWLAQRHRNIKFAMNIHSYGGYFMWPPGAYKLDGRVTLPRPTPQEEAYFLQSAMTIERGIAAERGTITWPTQTGPVTDVLYSAAGNSADELWYDLGIFGWDFEVGNDLWNPETQEWESVGFQPEFDEGHDEAMEYASGLIALIDVAADYRERRG
ncbi:MAG: peptidase M14 [Streptosporangiales bacterium]|nr:peptidase M14 [Streptosporangiales bacterium]